MNIPHQQISKPRKRSPLRKYLGREFFIIKRKLAWLSGNQKFAAPGKNAHFEYLLIQHRSFLLRPLKQVDMFLQYNKIKNLQLAIDRLDKIVIKPGETFSFWKTVGRPTKVKGYVTGLVLDNGNISRGIGGGLCQLGNLLYWMALHTPLTITERYRHGFDVFPDVNRTIPFGCGATLSYNYIDLQLQNNTSSSFQLSLWLDKEYLHGAITCSNKPGERYEIYETDQLFQHQWWGGYTRHNKIWRKTIDDSGHIISDEVITNNAGIMMYDPLLEM